MVRLTPARVSMRENSSIKRSRYRLNSTALCQGWKANVVDHIYQNSVSKNPGESQSVMQLAANASSPAWLSFSNSIRSSMENPIEVTGTFARRLSTSLAIAFDLCRSLNSTVSSKTVLPSLCSEGIDLLEIPGAFVVAGCQHASAAHGIPGRGVSGAVQASAHDGRRFEDRNIFARQAAVADHEGGGGQGSDAATDEIGL